MALSSGKFHFNLDFALNFTAIRGKTDEGLPRCDYRVTSYRPRVEQGFARIERWARVDTGESHFQTWTADNIRSVFGFNELSRIADPENPMRVFSWLLDRRADERGNVIAFIYRAENVDNVDITADCEKERHHPEQAQRYLKRIRYGN